MRTKQLADRERHILDKASKLEHGAEILQNRELELANLQEALRERERQVAKREAELQSAPSSPDVDEESINQELIEREQKLAEREAQMLDQEKQFESWGEKLQTRERNLVMHATFSGSHFGLLNNIF